MVCNPFGVARPEPGPVTAKRLPTIAQGRRSGRTLGRRRIPATERTGTLPRRQRLLGDPQLVLPPKLAAQPLPPCPAPLRPQRIVRRQPDNRVAEVIEVAAADQKSVVLVAN